MSRDAELETIAIKLFNERILAKVQDKSDPKLESIWQTFEQDFFDGKVAVHKMDYLNEIQKDGLQIRADATDYGTLENFGEPQNRDESQNSDLVRGVLSSRARSFADTAKMAAKGLNTFARKLEDSETPDSEIWTYAMYGGFALAAAYMLKIF